MGKAAVFLDRDGTIIEEAGYLSDPAQVRLIPGVADALARLRKAGFRIVVVTNQSGIARGYFGEADVAKVHAALDRLLAEHGAGIDAYYFCPHHPDFGSPCECRKPGTGMVKMAAMELGLDVAASYFVGDKAADVELGINSGGRAILVLTGYGKEEHTLLEAKGTAPYQVLEGLPEAADWILGQ